MFSCRSALQDSQFLHPQGISTEEAEAAEASDISCAGALVRSAWEGYWVLKEHRPHALPHGIPS